MEEKKDNRIIPFLVGLFMGWKGVEIIIHIVYLSIILGLSILLLIK